MNEARPKIGELKLDGFSFKPFRISINADFLAKVPPCLYTAYAERLTRLFIFQAGLASARSLCTKLPLSANDRPRWWPAPAWARHFTFRSNRGHLATYRVAERVDT